MLFLDKNILTLTKKNIQLRLKGLITAPKRIEKFLNLQEEENGDISLLKIKSKKIKKPASFRSQGKLKIVKDDHIDMKEEERKREIKLKMQEDNQCREQESFFKNLKTPIIDNETSTSHFMDIFTNTSSTADMPTSKPVLEKSHRIEGFPSKSKYPKPKLKFPIPDKAVLEKLNFLKSKASSGPGKKPPDKTSLEKNNSIFKESKVSQLKLKVKTIKRIINNYENNITSICKEYGNKMDENGKTFKICKEKWRILKIENRRNFVFLSHNYERVVGIPADIVAVSMLLYSAIKVGISGSLFVKAARNLSKTRVQSVSQLRDSEDYQFIKEVLKRD